MFYLIGLVCNGARARGTAGAAEEGGQEISGRQMNRGNHRSACAQGAHHADAGEHCRTASFRNEDQSFHRCQPFHRFVLGPRQPRDARAGILERHELAATWQHERLRR
jgi:hypothetical protein